MWLPGKYLLNVSSISLMPLMMLRIKQKPPYKTATVNKNLIF